MAKPSIPLTAERLREALNYDPLTGEFRWIKRRHGRRQKVGCKDNYGYVIINVDERPYKAHRLAWLWITGVWPEGQIDHVNRVKSDNRWSNLRTASHAENRANADTYRIRSDNKSGVAGVFKRKDCNRWVVNRNNKYIGMYETFEEAVAVAKRYGE